VTNIQQDAATTILENAKGSTTLHSLHITGLYNKVKRKKAVLKKGVSNHPLFLQKGP
jgi:hypothetical protein